MQNVIVVHIPIFLVYVHWIGGWTLTWLNAQCCGEYVGGVSYVIETEWFGTHSASSAVRSLRRRNVSFLQHVEIFLHDEIAYR